MQYIGGSNISISTVQPAAFAACSATARTLFTSSRKYDGEDFVHELAEVFEVAVAYLNAQRGALRDYVDRVAAVGDYHVYARAVAQLLAEHRERVVEDRRRVERVDAVPRSFCRVHRAPVEGDVVAKVMS